MMSQLDIYNSLPDGFLDIQPEKLGSLLKGPSLFHIQGEEDAPIFLATLLHGNEPTGFNAIQKYLTKFFRQGKLEKLPRDLILFVGNVLAAEKKLRLLHGQFDFNRIWSGEGTSEHEMAQSVIKYAKSHNLFLSVDIHNTSGKNPHYSCVNKLDAQCINLARTFSSTLIYFTEPHEVFSMAFSEFCPSITIEAGKPDEPNSEPHVLSFLETLFNLSSIPDTLNSNELKVFHSMVRIKVPDNSRIAFRNRCAGLDFCFPEEMDSLNFNELPINTLLGWRTNPGMDLLVLDEQNRNVASDYLEYSGTEIRLKRPVIPSMISTDEKIVHQDCLGYLMEPCELPENLRS